MVGTSRGGVGGMVKGVAVGVIMTPYYVSLRTAIVREQDPA